MSDFYWPHEEWRLRDTPMNAVEICMVTGTLVAMVLLLVGSAFCVTRAYARPSCRPPPDALYLPTSDLESMAVVMQPNNHISLAVPSKL